MTIVRSDVYPASSTFEGGQRVPNLLAMYKLGEDLDVSVDYVLGRADLRCPTFACRRCTMVQPSVAHLRLSPAPCLPLKRTSATI